MSKKIRVAFLIGDYPGPEHERRAKVALGYSNDQIEVGLIQVATTAYNRGNSPAELQLGLFVERRCANHFARYFAGVHNAEVKFAPFLGDVNVASSRGKPHHRELKIIRGSRFDGW